MRRSIIGLLFVVAFLSPGQFLYARGHGHHREWLELLSEEDRAKYRAARTEALKNSEVAAARERKKKADQEYRSLLNSEILKIDPSLRPLLEKLSELDKRDF